MPDSRSRSLVVLTGLLAFAWLGAACEKFVKAPCCPYPPTASVVPEVRPFHQLLAAHGHWTWLEPQGWVWRPSGVGSDFRPYVEGRWVASELGLFFLSEAPWAWAVYHYGRWHHDGALGWVWCPGLEWAPAWVAWRAGGGFVGWAALGPELLPASAQRPEWVYVPGEALLEPGVERLLVPSASAHFLANTTWPLGELPDREGRLRVLTHLAALASQPLFALRDVRSPLEEELAAGTVAVFRLPQHRAPARAAAAPRVPARRIPAL